MGGMGITALELRAIEAVLDARGGEVLDFTDAAFTGFFRDHGVDIEEARFSVDGRSKAKRLRCFLHVVSPPVTGRVLAELLQHRLVSRPERPRPVDLESYRKTVVRLGGTMPREASEASREQDRAEAAILRRVFKREFFSKLPFDAALDRALVDRMDEARRSLDAHAPLAAVVLAGSVLEGMCFAVGARDEDRVKEAYAAKYGKSAPEFHGWKLREWIEVLGALGDLSAEVARFGHAVRDFRGYIHPEQLSLRTLPDQQQAKLAFHLVIAAAEDLSRSAPSAPKASAPPVEESTHAESIAPERPSEGDLSKVDAGPAESAPAPDGAPS